MKKVLKLASILLIAITLVATGCSSSKKGHCSCAGMVGYGVR